MDARVRDTAAIDNAIDSALAEKRIVGGVVLVMQDGQIAYRRAAGLADRERAAPMREDAVFRLASLTKPLVTAAALRMVELGKIALADPVTRYLPDFRPALPNGEVPAITLRHLLTHTAGLSYGFMQPPDGSYHRGRVSDGLADPGVTMREELERIVPRGTCIPAGRTLGLFGRHGRAWRRSRGGRKRRPRQIVRRYVSAPLGATLAELRSDRRSARRGWSRRMPTGRPSPCASPMKAGVCPSRRAFRSTKVSLA